MIDEGAGRDGLVAPAVLEILQNSVTSQAATLASWRWNDVSPP
jgi:hypothetical protein